MILDRIPVIRGFLALWRNYRAKRQLLAFHDYMKQKIKCTDITSVNIDSSGCVFTLKDQRSFNFDPGKSAGWLYSIPFSGTFEEKETEFLRRTIKKGWICLDIGACFGWYSVLLSNLTGESGQIHAFEPVTENRECLQLNLDLNNCSNVNVSPLALGDKETMTQIYLPIDGVSGSLRAHAKLKDCHVMQVEETTVDLYIASKGLQRIDFIKADIEGAELLMLEGAMQSLQKFRPMLMLEIQSHSTKLFGYKTQKIFNLLDGLGYSAYYVSVNYELIPLKNEIALSESLPDYNFVFIHS